MLTYWHVDIFAHKHIFTCTSLHLYIFTAWQCAVAHVIRHTRGHVYVCCSRVEVRGGFVALGFRPRPPSSLRRAATDVEQTSNQCPTTQRQRHLTQVGWCCGGASSLHVLPFRQWKVVSLLPLENCWTPMRSLLTVSLPVGASDSRCLSDSLDVTEKTVSRFQVWLMLFMQLLACSSCPSFVVFSSPRRVQFRARHVRLYFVCRTGDCKRRPLLRFKFGDRP